MDFKNERDWEAYYKHERDRFEFMRRSPQYRAAWEKAQKLRKNAEKRQPGCIGDSPTETTLYDVLKEGKEEKEMAKSFGLSSRLYDPNISWDQMSYSQRRGLVYMAFGMRREVFRVRWPTDDNSKVSIDIDFNEVTSTDALKKYIIEFIDDFLLHYPEYKRQPYKKKYVRILKVGDLKDRNRDMTWPEIAEIIFPKDRDAESAVKKVQQDWNKYNELINGGYKKLTYP